ncbi:MAG: polyprenyl synthetase family protein [Chloroflexi bacterium]|nr:polyprenyl synthetase family protein [Chloroflexota bacterium]
MNILGILEPLRDDLVLVERKMRGALDVEHPTLAELLTYVIDHGGKRVRPALVITASQFYPVPDQDKVIQAAAAIELLHTASLVHDDLVDNAMLRRGNPTLNTHWGGGTTVLIGDYLLARSAWLASYTRNLRLIEKFSDTLVVIVDGELREVFKAAPIFSRDDYNHRIYAKTASLFAVSAEAGAMLSQAPDAHIEALRNYGCYVGMAFQIVDDILDFTGKEGTVGKTLGNDLRQNVVTLPLICWHERNPGDERIERIIRRDGDRESLLQAVVRDVAGSPAIEAAFDEARAYVDKAKVVLDGLPESPSKGLMRDLADFVVERKS